MIVYYLIFLIPAFATLGLKPYYNESTKRFFFIIISTFIVLIIGLRYEIGGDWNAYLAYYEYYSSLNFSEFLVELIFYDPFYVFLNYISGKINGGIYFVNTIAGLIFMYGYTKFSLKQNMYSLAYLIGIPYLVIVVSMGYTRQSIAIGFVFLAYIALIENKLYKALLFGLLATLSHKTAIIFFLIIALYYLSLKNVSFKKLLPLVAISFIAFYMFYYPFHEYFLMAYIEDKMHSEGGFIRILMNLIPALIYLVFAKKFKTTLYEKKLWIIISLLSILALPMIILGYTTVADRLSLYFSPIQMVSYGKFIEVVKDKEIKYIFLVMLVTTYFLVLYIWLNYAVHKDYWVPYKNILLQA